MHSRSSSFSFSIESRLELHDQSTNDIKLFHHEVSHNSNPLRHEKFIFYQFLFFAFWFLLWVCIYFALYVLVHSRRMRANEDGRLWEYFYFIFLCLMIVIKWVLKKVSRGLDECQITASTLRLSFSLGVLWNFIVILYIGRIP